MVPVQTCIAITPGPDGVCMTFPGGSKICLQYPTAGLASVLGATKAMLAQVQTALAPLDPFFKVIACLDAAKDLVTDPSKFLAALANLATLYPPLVLPAMIGRILDFMIIYLQGTINQLAAFVTQMAAIAAAATKAQTLECPSLSLAIDCANAQLALQLDGLNQSLSGINGLVTTLRILLALVPGSPELPDPLIGGDITDLEAGIAMLSGIVTTLQAIRQAFPPAA